MAASRDLRSHVTDVVTCPICLELFSSPKSLPCLHTFCLKCIGDHYRDKKPGAEAACPVCRQKFNIPEGGVEGLVGNFFIAGLVEARKTASDVVVQVPCDVCVLECGNNDSVAVSTMYCIDCSQKLCEPCSRPHRRMMKGGPHKVVPIGSEHSEVEAELIKMQSGKCDKHKDDDIRLYCFDCKMNICMMCFAEDHQQHKCKNVNTVADECIKQIDADLATVKQKADGALIAKSIIDRERGKFLAGVNDVRDKLASKGDELKQLIDTQVNELMLAVQSLKTETCKEIASLKDFVEMHLLTFETFSAYCRELKLKGKPCDITRAANDLHTRAIELMQNDATSVDYCAPVVMFTPMNIQELLDARENFIGKVKLDNDSAVRSSFISFLTLGEKPLVQQLAQSMETERSLRQQIQVCNSQLADNEKIWKHKVDELHVQFTERETNIKAENVESEKRIIELLAECEQLRNSEGDLRVKLEKSGDEFKRLNQQLEQLRKRENSLTEQLETTSNNEQLLMKHLAEVPRVIHTFPDTKSVRGVTSVDDELFVLRNKYKDQVTVYNTTTTAYSLVRRLSLRAGVEDLWDMTSCRHYRCLYIADTSNCCVHRVELNGNVTKLSVKNEPCCLSVTSQFTVLATCLIDSKLLELTTEGKQLRVINLQSDIVHPIHAIQQSNGQFVVSHGDWNDPIHKVCIVDTNGHVTQSYGGPRGSATVGLLNVPCHLAVDKD